MIDLYGKMYKKYVEERSLIPKGNLVEVKYEDFIQNPLPDVEKIYSTLGLKGFEATKKSFYDYATSQKFFKTSNYEVDLLIKEKLGKNWKFVFDEFGYEM